MPCPLRHPFALLLALLPAGCGTRAAPTHGAPDAGTASIQDAAMPPSDAGATDGDAGAADDDAGQPPADAGAPPADAGSAVVTAPIPEPALRAVLGCWLADHEHWTITRTTADGARVERKPLGDGLRAPYRERAQPPADLMYNPSNGYFAFHTPGRHHPLMFVFQPVNGHLEGSWFSNHDSQHGYGWTGNNATLRRCGAPAGKGR